MDWKQILESVWNAVRDWSPALLAAAATLVVGILGAKIARAVLRHVLRRSRMDETLVGFVSNLGYMMLLAFIVVSALDTLGVATGSFVAIVGAAGLAVGFALQGSLSNFAAGVMIVTFRPFRVGDFIEAAGVAGTVEDIHVFSTRLTTPDNKRIILPNSNLMGGNVTNFSSHPKRRVDMVFGISYEDDLRKAKAILEKICQAHPLVLDDPAPTVAVAELGDSSVNLRVRPWTKTADYWTVHADVTESVKLRFDEAGISLPYPQRDVHLHQVA